MLCENLVSTLEISMGFWELVKAFSCTTFIADKYVYYVSSDMAKVINNTDLDKISQTVANGKRDKESLRRPVKLKVEWNLDPTKGYQFRTELSFEKGKGVI
jgi:hypothetical protein